MKQTSNWKNSQSGDEMPNTDDAATLETRLRTMFLTFLSLSADLTLPIEYRTIKKVDTVEHTVMTEGGEVYCLRLSDQSWELVGVDVSEFFTHREPHNGQSDDPSEGDPLDVS